MKFKVFGQDIDIKKVRQLTEIHGAAGIYNPRNKTITVDSALKGNDLLHTYLHELVHATVDRLGLHNTQLSHDLEEMICENIPLVILENFSVKIK